MLLPALVRRLGNIWSLQGAPDSNERAVDAAKDVAQVSVKKEPCLHVRPGCVVVREVDHVSDVDKATRVPSRNMTHYNTNG